MAEFTVVGELIYDSEHDELYRQEERYEQDDFWIDQAEADAYRHEDIIDDEGWETGETEYPDDIGVDDPDFAYDDRVND